MKSTRKQPHDQERTKTVVVNKEESDPRLPKKVEPQVHACGLMIKRINKDWSHTFERSKIVQQKANTFQVVFWLKQVTVRGSNKNRA